MMQISPNRIVCISAQAIEVTHVTEKFYCSGQVALDENGMLINAEMHTQLQ